ncbi:MAG TPA: c-type cytochrome [Alphaproteobacteria bacterium]|nr:c-type cytochrome [Alphaproteobacteria bacterium]
MRTILLIAVFLVATPAFAQTSYGDPQAGLKIALRDCAACHIVAGRQGGPAPVGVPTFAAIAHMPSTTALSLRAFLQTPHPPMPDLALTRTEMEDAVSYILSLRN